MKKTLRNRQPETSMNIPPENSLRPRKWVSDGNLFTDGDYVIM